MVAIYNALVCSSIYLGRESEYSIDQVTELRDLIFVCRATYFVNSNRSSRSIDVSLRRD